MKIDRARAWKSLLSTLRSAINLAAVSFSTYITEETFLGGKKFSYRDHEYQEYISKVVEDNPGKEVCVSKCSQIGLSELFNRIVLARMRVRPRTHALISFPSKTFAQEVLKTRFTEVIQESPCFRDHMDPNIDSASSKAMINGSIVYALGGNKTKTTQSLLNRPIDTLLIDEYDRQDPDIVSGYRSRTTHTPEEELLTAVISTPTAQGVGIDYKVNSAHEQHVPYVRCLNCGHEFIADFYRNIVLPGYRGPGAAAYEPGAPIDLDPADSSHSPAPLNGDLRLLNKQTLSKYDPDSAYLECPSCLGVLTKETRDTVWRVNYKEDGAKDVIGISIDPFAAMGFITIPRLLRDSVTYTSHTEFMNQGLGKVADKKESTISKEAIQFIPSAGELPIGSHILGLDLGKLCHIFHGILRRDGVIEVLRSYIVRLADLEKVMDGLVKTTFFQAMVMDSGPYSDLVYRFVAKYPRMFSAAYYVPTGRAVMPEMYKVTERDKYDELVRLVTVNQPLVMSTIADSMSYAFEFRMGEYDEYIKKHFTDMRKVRDYSFALEERYRWVKSEGGNDHFFHTLVYLYMAGKLVLGGVTYSMPMPPPVVGVINPEKRREKLMVAQSR